MEEQHIKIGLIQTFCAENPKDNLYRNMGLIRDAAEEGAQIICLQELFNTRYFCMKYDEKYFDWAEPANGELVQSLSDLSKELNIVILAPFFEKRDNQVYHNSMVVIDSDGKILGEYRKTHIKDDPDLSERLYFTAGGEENSFRVFETAYGNIGALIGWDQWFPEAARITALKGADVLFFPTAIGNVYGKGRQKKQTLMEAWITILRSHAIANGCFVASVNRTGKEKEGRFWGGSFVSDPFGKIIDKAGSKEAVLVTEIDLNEVNEQRRSWPFFKDRRIDLYRPILKRVDD